MASSKTLRRRSTICNVVLPLVRRMGSQAAITMERPGYVPRGGGILHLTVHPVRQGLQRLVLEESGTVERVWGIALASHLVGVTSVSAWPRRVTSWPPWATGPDIEAQDDTRALQLGPPSRSSSI